MVLSETGIGVIAYSIAAIGYLGLSAFLLAKGDHRSTGRFLLLVAIVNAAWSASAVSLPLWPTMRDPYIVLEVARYFVWFLFFLKLFKVSTRLAHLRLVIPISVVLITTIAAVEIMGWFGDTRVVITMHVMLALLGLIFIEQMFRNTRDSKLWAAKFLYIGVGGIMAFDFYIYSDALLFGGIDRELWQSRGLVNAIAIPLIAVSVSRSRSWSVELFISRDVVMHSTAIMGGGIYLLSMAAAAYYINEIGGSWGKFSQILFLVLAVTLLATILMSAQLRARARVFLVKHFYRNKYDYRVEWLKLTESLSEEETEGSQYSSVIRAIADIVQARRGQLYLKNEATGNYRNIACYNTERMHQDLTSGDPLVTFLEDKNFILNVDDIDSKPDEYADLKTPDWVGDVIEPWLVIPLVRSDSMLGFMLLSDPLLRRSVDWEDRDMLKSAARQVTSHLMVVMTSHELAEAKQFEVFTRLSAYMVHDLKNIAAELEMIAKNASKHRANEEFVIDAFETVEHAADDIQRLLQQLRDRRAQSEKPVTIELGELLDNLLSSREELMPRPTLTRDEHSCFVNAERGRLTNVLSHMIENACQATEGDGEVELETSLAGTSVRLVIKDTGIGMDETFIRDRLFKPFDTTKGNAGMGIGMHESKEYIEGIGGRLDVESAPGIGTSMIIELPSVVVSE